MGRVFKNGDSAGMKNVSLIISIASFLFATSCSTCVPIVNNRINSIRTTSLTRSLHKKNGNAFYLDTTWSPYSVVWSYGKGSISIFKVKKGVVRKKQVYSNEGIMQYINCIEDNLEKELESVCGFWLDGDGFGFIITIDSLSYKANYPVEIESFKKGTFNSSFLNKIRNDIIEYQMW